MVSIGIAHCSLLCSVAEDIAITNPLVHAELHVTRQAVERNVLAHITLAWLSHLKHIQSGFQVLEGQS
jgi:hypothetical protein